MTVGVELGTSTVQTFRRSTFWRIPGRPQFCRRGASVVGHLSSETGRIDDACAELHEAMAVARSQGVSTFELRAPLNLAEHDLQEGRLAVRSALATFPEPAPWPEVTAGHSLLD